MKRSRLDALIQEQEQVQTLDRKPASAARKSGYQHHGEALSPMLVEAARKMLEEES